MDGVQRLLRGRSGVIERMAPRTIVRSLSRMAVAVAALMVAVSVIIGVGVMIGSFRQTVELWLDDVLQADIFMSSPTLGSGSLHAELNAGRCCAELQALPGVAAGGDDARQADVAARLGLTPPTRCNCVWWR